MIWIQTGVRILIWPCRNLTGVLFKEWVLFLIVPLVFFSRTNINISDGQTDTIYIIGLKKGVWCYLNLNYRGPLGIYEYTRAELSTKSILNSFDITKNILTSVFSRYSFPHPPLLPLRAHGSLKTLKIKSSSLHILYLLVFIVNCNPWCTSSVWGFTDFTKFKLETGLLLYISLNSIETLRRKLSGFSPGITVKTGFPLWLGLKTIKSFYFHS